MNGVWILVTVNMPRWDDGTIVEFKQGVDTEPPALGKAMVGRFKWVFWPERTMTDVRDAQTAHGKPITKDQKIDHTRDALTSDPLATHMTTTTRKGNEPKAGLLGRLLGR